MIVSQDDAVVALAAGEVVAIPTDTVYGLAVDPHQLSATDRLFGLKARPDTVALPVLVAARTTAERLGMFDARAASLVERYWPGALAIVMRRQATVRFDLGGDPATVGLRCPAHPVALELLTRAGPLAVTSANTHGGQPSRSAAEVLASLGESLLVVDGGVCAGEPSTVVSLAAELACLRQGAIPMSEIEQALSGGMAGAN